MIINDESISMTEISMPKTSVAENGSAARENLKIMHLLFGMDEVRALLGDLQQHTIALQVWHRTLLTTFPLALLLGLGYLETPYAAFYSGFLCLAMATVGYALVMWLAELEKKDNVLQTLNNTLDVRAISPLCEALEWHSLSVQHVAQNTLPRLLKQLRASDSLLLTRVARDCLYRRLILKRADRDERLLTAILQALEQVGDAQAVPAVERLVAETPRTPHEERVHLAAQACLPYLHARFGHHAGRDTLLRATNQEEPTPHMLLRSSQTPPENLETLLRPVKETSDPQPEQLLHPRL